MKREQWLCVRFFPFRELPPITGFGDFLFLFLDHGESIGIANGYGGGECVGHGTLTHPCGGLCTFV